MIAPYSTSQKKGKLHLIILDHYFSWIFIVVAALWGELGPYLGGTHLKRPTTSHCIARGWSVLSWG